MNTLQEILENSDREFEDRFKVTHCNCVLEEHTKDDFCPSRTSSYTFSPERIQSYIHARDKKLLEAIIEDLENMPLEVVGNSSAAVDQVIRRLQDLIK